MLDRLVTFFTSMRLTVVCLALAIILVFVGTLAQVNEGLYQAQDRYFRSLLIWWHPSGTGWQIPVFPGGYLVGTVLVMNLIAAHLKRFRFSRNQAGIYLTHIGLILLLLGQLATDVFSHESLVRFHEGESRNYSESPRRNELVFITSANQEGLDEVVAIPEQYLANRTVIEHEKLPFSIRVKEYHVNSQLQDRAPMVDTAPPPATQGIGSRVTLTPKPATRKMDENNLPAAVLELVGPEGSLGTWLVSPWLVNPQEITVKDQTWRVAFRWKRLYTPYSIQLLKTTHEVYRGTDIPKNFQSRVRIENPVTGENREVDIFMNHPLRYGGLTYYQYQMGRDQVDSRLGTSTLQAVRNPSWLTPYLGCIIVGLGLLLQFLMHLFSFLRQQKSL